MGWWDLDVNGEPISPAKVFQLNDFPETALMAHVMCKAGIFSSVGQAKKNGWNKPIETGEWCLTKKKIRVIVKP